MSPATENGHVLGWHKAKRLEGLARHRALMLHATYMYAWPLLCTLRLAALLDGIDPPENMRRCFANNYDLEVPPWPWLSLNPHCLHVNNVQPVSEHAFVHFSLAGQAAGRICGPGGCWLMVQHAHCTRAPLECLLGLRLCYSCRASGVGGTPASTSGWCGTCMCPWEARTGDRWPSGPYSFLWRCGMI